jgi:hypothetical protein
LCFEIINECHWTSGSRRKERNEAHLAHQANPQLGGTIGGFHMAFIWLSCGFHLAHALLGRDAVQEPLGIIKSYKIN